MIRSLWPSRRFQALVGLTAFLAAVAAGSALLAPAADHRDGPIFVNTKANGRADINDVYVFASPTNPTTNTVLIMTESPGPGPETPTTFDQTVTFDIKVDNTGDAVEDITFRATFGAPDPVTGAQTVTLRALPVSRFPPTGILAQGPTNKNIPAEAGTARPGIMFRAGIQDDPFFFDATGFKEFVANGTAKFPRDPGVAVNFFGPNVNTLAIVLEIPNTVLAPGGNGSIIGVWGTTSRSGVQVDRMGRPAINTALIPPVPRSDLSLGDQRNAFNAGLPRNDVTNFGQPVGMPGSGMTTVLKNVYSNLAGKDQTGLVGVLLPDLLMFKVGDTSHFGTFIGPGNSILGNGRYLTDDVIDFELNVLTGGNIKRDNVDDDNGGKVTDGTTNPDTGLPRQKFFPYIGAANSPAGDFNQN